MTVVIQVIRRLTGVKFCSPARDINLLRLYVSESAAVTCGDFSRVDENSIEDFVTRFSDIISTIESYSSSPFVPRFVIDSHLLFAGKMALSKLQLQRRDKIIRRQPFGILISGKPGCGKSFAAMSLSTRLYQAIHGTPSNDDLVVLNEGDAFQSEFRTTHKIVIFDDLGATRVTTVPSDPFRKVIDFINNIPRTALNPNVELKGSVWIEPEIVVATTNMVVPFSRDAQRNTESVFCLEAINRRFPLMIHQSSYDSFSIVPRGITHRQVHNLPKIGFEQLLAEAFKLHQDHFDSQVEFVELVERTLPMKSALKAESHPMMFPGVLEALHPTLELVSPRERYLRRFFNDMLFQIFYPDLQDGGWCPTSHGFINAYGGRLMSPEHRHIYRHVDTLPFSYTYDELLDESFGRNPPSPVRLRAESSSSSSVPLGNGSPSDPLSDETKSDDNTMQSCFVFHDDSVSPVTTLSGSAFRSFLLETEADQISRFLRVFPFPTTVRRNVHTNMSICPGTTLGEIDILLKGTQDSYMVVECKRSNGDSGVREASKQSRRYSSIISLLQPRSRVIGVIYTYRNARVVFDNAVSVDPTGFTDFLDMLDYKYERVKPLATLSEEIATCQPKVQGP